MHHQAHSLTDNTGSQPRDHWLVFAPGAIFVIGGLAVIILDAILGIL